MSNRSNKRRTGCEQCKRRKVGCDEKKPVCSRCAARGETCTGNFTWDSWQIERPWLWSETPPTMAQLLENDVLRHWYDSACLNMALFRPPVNPLSYEISTWLRHSKALRHTLESVAEGHREFFAHDRLSKALVLRGLAISSLKGEVSRIQSPYATKSQTLLRTTILSSLILCISSGWLDSSGKDAGLEFLRGAQTMIGPLAESKPDDDFAFYLFGLFLHCCAFWCFLSPSSNQPSVPRSVIEAVRSPRFRSLVHPVTGIASTLCPLITDAGNYYRRVVESRVTCPTLQAELESKLNEWAPPGAAPQALQLVELADGYRAAGLLLLFQAKMAGGESTDSDEFLSLLLVMRIMDTVKHLPAEDTLQNWLGPLIMIAGSELPASFTEERSHIEKIATRLAQWTRVPSYSQGLEMVREVWRLRDAGEKVSWLEVMVQQDLALVVG